MFTRASGDESLNHSGARRSDDGADKKIKTIKKNPPDSDKKGGPRRVSDVGRALRSVYDETLREDVPDDFLDLLGKLS